MVKEYCFSGAIRERTRHHGFDDDLPAFSHFRIVRMTDDSFVLSLTPLRSPASQVIEPRQSSPSLFTYRREPFGLADEPPQSDDASPPEVAKPWQRGPCIRGDGDDPWCGPPMPAVPIEPESGLAGWRAGQVALPSSDGTSFYYWQGERGPLVFRWRAGEPYWEDSLGCGRLVRSLDGTVHRPSATDDVGEAEPRIVAATNDQISKDPPPSALFDAAPQSVVSPRWKVGDGWVTQHRCPRRPRAHAREGAWVFGWPPPPGPQRSTFAFYEVVQETSDAYLIRERKELYQGLRVRGDFRFPKYDSHAMTYMIRKRPFGIVRWQRFRQMSDYSGGPCLNTGPVVDRCPFVMPADGPADGSTPPSWVAEQTVRRSTDGVEFDYSGRDGTRLTIRWRDGEPWPEATPSCTRLLRNPDGSVINPESQDVLSDWEESDSFRQEMEETVDLPIRRPWHAPF